jgi:hypothetical protein
MTLASTDIETGIELGTTQPVLDLNELVQSLLQGRTPNLGEEQLVGLENFFATMQSAIELTRKYRTDAAGLIQISALDGDMLVDEQPDDDSQPSLREPVAIGLTQTKETSGDKVPAVKDDNEQEDELELTDEARFILEQLKSVGVGVDVGRGYFIDQGFNKVQQRISDGAYQKAFSLAIAELDSAGLIVRPSRGVYQLAGEAFLA